MWRFFVRAGYLVAIALLAGASCASYELVQLPARQADVYPSAEIRQEIAVAVDEIADPRRVKRYFGANLLEAGILPVQVVVSNHGDRRISIEPSDLLLLEGERVVDPVPLEQVVEVPKAKALFLREKTARQLEEFYATLAFKETVLAPGTTYQGVMFFDAVETGAERGFRSRFFRVVSLFPQPTMRLHIVLTDLESRDRIRFGPFGVHPQRQRGI